MKKTAIGLSVVLVVLLSATYVFGGPNSAAKIRIDLNATSYGNQNLNSISCPGTSQIIRVDIYAIDVVNLDTYEFVLLYPASDLTYLSSFEDQPITFESNILFKDGGSTLGQQVDATSGSVSVAGTLTGADPAQAPEGEGLLAQIVFRTKVSCPGGLTFGAVSFLDVYGAADVITDKGDASLPVQMANMMATASQEEGVIVEWQTESELNCSGFNVWRSLSMNDDYSQINASLISGTGNTSNRQEYSFTDRDVETGEIYWYKIEEISTSGASTFYGPLSVTGVNPIPTEYALSQNYPNPFNPETSFHYQLPKDADISIHIYNTLGKRIRTIFNGRQEAGYYTSQWNGLNDQGRRVSSGLYILQIQSEDFNAVKKISLMR